MNRSRTTGGGVRCRIWLMLSLLLACAATSHADGKFMPRTKALVRDPAMPSQAAVIGYRDGLETLIVESAVQSDGEPLAWVVPVPSEPDVIKPVLPGTVQTALELVGPAILEPREARDEVKLAGVLAAACTCLGLGVRFAMARRWGWALGLFFGIASGVVLLPALAKARGGAVPGVHLVRSVTAGSYQVDVVRATRAEDLMAWLTARDFALPDAARPVIEAAIAKGWVFCAAEVALPAAGAGRPVAPHPLKLVFRSDELVYPLALTAVGGGEIDLDLVVFASAPVGHAALETWRASVTTPALADDPMEHRSQGRIGHPELRPLALEHPWVTRLHGRLDLRRFRSDLVLHPEPSIASVATLASPADRRRVVAATCLWFAAGAALVVIPLCGHRERRRWAGRTAIVLLGVAAIAAAAVGGTRGAAYVVTEIETASMRGGLRSAWAERRVTSPDAGDWSEQDVRRELQDALEWTMPDGTTASREGSDLPFGWQVETAADGSVWVTLRDASGRPFRGQVGRPFLMPIDGAPIDAPSENPAGAGRGSAG